MKTAIKTFSYQGPIYRMLALGNFVIYLCWNGKGKELEQAQLLDTRGAIGSTRQFHGNPTGEPDTLSKHGREHNVPKEKCEALNISFPFSITFSQQDRNHLNIFSL